MCVAWSGRAPEHLREILAKFEAGLPKGWLPHRFNGKFLPHIEQNAADNTCASPNPK